VALTPPPLRETRSHPPASQLTPQLRRSSRGGAHCERSLFGQRRVTKAADATIAKPAEKKDAWYGARRRSSRSFTAMFERLYRPGCRFSTTARRVPMQLAQPALWVVCCSPRPQKRGARTPTPALLVVGAVARVGDPQVQPLEPQHRRDRRCGSWWRRASAECWAHDQPHDVRAPGGQGPARRWAGSERQPPRTSDCAPSLHCARHLSPDTVPARSRRARDPDSDTFIARRRRREERTPALAGEGDIAHRTASRPSASPCPWSSLATMDGLEYREKRRKGRHGRSEADTQALFFPACW